MSKGDILKRFILQNKWGGPRALHRPADAKPQSGSCPSLMSVKKTSVDSRSGSIPTFPRCRSPVKMCGASRLLAATRWVTACRPHCTSSPVPLSTSVFLGLWLVIAAHDRLHTHAWPLTVAPIGYGLDLFFSFTRWHVWDFFTLLHFNTNNLPLFLFFPFSVLQVSVLFMQYFENIFLSIFHIHIYYLGILG